MDGNKTERLAVSPFPHDAGRVVAGIGHRADTPQRIESTLSDAYMDMRFGAPDPVWPEGAPFIHAETAIVRQRHCLARDRARTPARDVRQQHR